MGRHIDVSFLNEDECGKIIDVLAKDIALRKSELERVRYIHIYDFFSVIVLI